MRGDKRLLHARLTPAGRERVRLRRRPTTSSWRHLLTLLGDDASVVTDALARVSAHPRSPRTRLTEKKAGIRRRPAGREKRNRSPETSSP